MNNDDVGTLFDKIAAEVDRMADRYIESIGGAAKLSKLDRDGKVQLEFHLRSAYRLGALTMLRHLTEAADDDE